MLPPTLPARGWSDLRAPMIPRRILGTGPSSVNAQTPLERARIEEYEKLDAGNTFRDTVLYRRRIDREVRGLPDSSDHAPVWVALK